MKTGLLRKIAVAGIAMLMLIALASGIGQAGSLTVTITYKANYVGSTEYVEDKPVKGSPYTIRTNPFTHPGGYIFTGWNTLANGTGIAIKEGLAVTVNATGIASKEGQIVPTPGNITLYAQWKPKVTITYKANYVRGPEDVTDDLAKGSFYTVRDDPFTRSGYIFTGWNTQVDGSGNALYAGQVMTPNTNFTLYAQWTNTVTIRYKSNYTDGPEDVVDTFKTGNLLAPFTPSTIRYNPFTSSGYIFTGWNTKANGTGDAYKEGQPAPANVNLTLYAQWKVKITYMSNYPAGVGPGPANMTDNPVMGSSYKIWNNPFATPAGYTFAGWNTRTDGRGTQNTAGETIKADTNLTLYAQWKVTITYMSNYPAGVGLGSANMTDNPVMGSFYTIWNNPFVTPAGYTFVYWTTQQNGSGIKYTGGETIKADTNLTLYAQWKEMPIVDIPTAVDGRILPPAKTGDNSSNWIEIARNGKYSLIVRAKSVAYANFDDGYDVNCNYSTSYLRGVCNAFFNSKTVYNKITLYSTLLPNARLREYTVTNNAIDKVGTSCKPASLSDGYSKPTTTKVSKGDDICFALSYTEAAKFISIWYVDLNGIKQPSPNIAIKNYNKIDEWDKFGRTIWLRSPGFYLGTVGTINNIVFLNGEGIITDNKLGTVCGSWAPFFDSNFHPAVWVDSAIFN